MNTPEFKERIKSNPRKVTRKKDIEEFEKIYSELFEYLKKIDFNSLKTNYKVNKSNYKKNPNSENFELQLTDDVCVQIEKYIKLLSQPKYEKFLAKKIISNRSSMPNNSDLSEKDKQLYERKLADEDLTIRLMVYIKELVMQYNVYHNHDIRYYYINMCAAIFLSYCRTHPLEQTKIHFRFKSPKGLITKLAKNIILNGTYERNPETSTDTFKFNRISDAFGAKIVSEKGYNPNTSADSDILALIENRNQHLEKLKQYETFKERIDNLKNGEKEEITYKEYFENCISILTSLLVLIDKKEHEVISSLKDKIILIEAEEEKYKTTDNLCDNIKTVDFFDDKQFSFETYYNSYAKRIYNPLALAGLKKGLNKIFNNTGKSQIDILEKRTIDAFQIQGIYIDNKSTSSGHEGIHIDIVTPYGTFELQVQTLNQYISDQIGEITAHGKMPNKSVTLFDVPKAYENISGNTTDYIIQYNSDGKKVYYLKKEVAEFINKVQCITAYKGKISFNNGLKNAEITLYSSLYNYYSLAMELPDSDPYKKDVLDYFKRLSSKSGAVKKMIFHHPDPIVKYVDFSQISDYIFNSSLSNNTHDFNEQEHL